jgi:predicted secreted hydrolase
MTRGLLLLLINLLPAIATAQDRLGDLRDQGAGFTQVTPGRELVFPRDHGAHPDYRIEWWYLTANLQDPQGRQWGVQWTLFRQALSPTPAGPGWSNNQVWMAHAAITTPTGHVHAQRFARGGIGQAGVSDPVQSGRFEAWLDDWHWRANGAHPFPAQLRFSFGDYTVDLQLSAQGERVLNGVDGYSQKSAQGQASYYYSQPHVAVQGSITSAEAGVAVAGQGWLDREWSSQPLAENQQGWDWFSLHLDDGRKLMVYRLRHDDGQHWLSGSLVTPGEARRHLRHREIELEPLQSREISLGQGARGIVPLDWRITLNDPRQTLQVRPLYDQQWMDTRVPYWEGVMLVYDPDGQAIGKGYMELTGYP